MFAPWIRAARKGMVAVGLGLAAGGLFPVPAPGMASAQEGDLDAPITNVATVQFTVVGPALTLETNAASFTRQAPFATDASVSAHRPGGGAPETALVEPVGSARVALPEAPDAFRSAPAPTTLSGQPLDLSAPLGLAPMAAIVPGEPVILRVSDGDANLSGSLVDSLIVSVTGRDGREVRVELPETGPDTGVFTGAVATVRAGRPAAAHEMALDGGDRLTLTYVDADDPTDTVTVHLEVDLPGRAFDSLSGDALGGFTIRLVEASTGAPATVFGEDGVTPHPASVVTGAADTATDGTAEDGAPGATVPAGALEPGEFVFPLVPAGTYRLEVTDKDGYVFPSGFTPEALERLDLGPLDLGPGSFGEPFELTAAGPILFDVPLDHPRSLDVTKQALSPSAAIGESLIYELTVTNLEPVDLPLVLEDLLPPGFRLAHGTVQLDGAPLDTVSVAPDGVTLTLDAGRIAAGATRTLSYAATIGAGAPDGYAINTARALLPDGRPLSNEAEAAVLVRNDFFDRRITLVGRVAEAACDPDQPFARHLSHGRGVEGVRVYLETGEYVVTDRDGLYHFPDVMPGTRVVQMDAGSLPPGFAPMQCEESTRYAGSATSQFLDAQGGSVWRANFYLQQVAGAETQAGQDIYDAFRDHLNYDQAWLDSQPAKAAFVYPDPGQTPGIPSVNLGMTAPAGARVSLTADGKPVPAYHREPGLVSSDGQVQLLRWRGINLLSGETVFEAEVTHRDGRVERVRRSFWYVEEITRAELIRDQSNLVADGRTPPVIAIRLTDRAGRPVRAHLGVGLEVSAPYQLDRADRRLNDRTPFTAGEVERITPMTDTDGVLRLPLEPTLDAGLVRITVNVGHERTQEIAVYLEPHAREWIVVGLADGVLSRDGLSRNGEVDGGERLALFAKGMVKGDWLLTVALDTAKKRGQRDEALYELIDPNAYYTLYGDESRHGHEAESRYPVYVKLERRAAQILFGDFATQLGGGTLTAYNRMLSGLRGTLGTERYTAVGFAAETSQSFVKDELAANGTTGPYRLTGAPVVRNSESVRLEIRERTRPDRVLETESLRRWIDYDIDYASGELVFRRPVDVADDAFNERVIVIDYETVGEGERSLTAGGRAALHTADGRSEVGLTLVHDGAASTTTGMETTLAGVDLRQRLAEHTEAVVEVAHSETRLGDEDGGGSSAGNAVLARLTHEADSVRGEAYFRQEDGAFGLGQTGSATEGVRRFGLRGQWTLTGSGPAEEDAAGSEEAGQAGISGEPDEADAPRAGASHVLRADAFREEDLGSEASRTVAELGLDRRGAAFALGSGLRSVTERLMDGEERTSLLGTLSASRRFAEWGLNLMAERAQPLTSEGGSESSAYPQRTVLGLDKTVTQYATLQLRHEIVGGEGVQSQSTLAGLSVRPMEGMSVTAALSEDRPGGSSAPRRAADLTADQTFRFRGGWTASVGAAARQDVSGGEEAADPFADEAVSPLAPAPRSAGRANDDFRSIYAGIGYQDGATVASARIEHIDSRVSERTTLTLGGAREAGKTFSYAAGARIEEGDRDRSAELRLGSSWRPRAGGPIYFNRLDLAQSDREEGGESWRVVNNFAANTMLTPRTQAAIFHGVKYSSATLNSVQISGWTHALTGELRHDVRPWMDVGLQAGALHNTTTGTTDYAFGPSVGFTPRDNVWLSVGYNVAGFEDRDFDAAAYTRDGLYFKLRMKFDETTLSGLLERVSPRD